MGIVGVGGIGFEFMVVLCLIKYDEVFVILLFIFICVFVVDGIGLVFCKYLK